MIRENMKYFINILYNIQMCTYILITNDFKSNIKNLIF